MIICVCHNWYTHGTDGMADTQGTAVPCVPCVPAVPCVPYFSGFLYFNINLP